MTSSQKLIDAIKHLECNDKPILEAIWDKTGKVWMIGYGHSPGDVKQGDRITAQQAEDLLRKDLKMFEKYASVVRGVKTQGQFDAVVDFMYNCGVDNFNKSTLKKYIEAGRKTWEIQEQFLKWVNSGGQKLGGLVTRRIWDAQRWADWKD
jgi:lysozyme